MRSYVFVLAFVCDFGLICRFFVIILPQQLALFIATSAIRLSCADPAKLDSK